MLPKSRLGKIITIITIIIINIIIISIIIICMIISTIIIHSIIIIIIIFIFMIITLYGWVSDSSVVVASLGVMDPVPESSTCNLIFSSA